MPSSLQSPTSKKSMRRTQRTTTPKRANSDATSSSGSADSADLTALSDSEGDASPAPAAYDYQPDELDEPISYPFQKGDAVWVKTEDGEWIQGTIAGVNTRRGATRQKEGVFYPVAFRHNSRKYFAPLNGDVKPDTAEVRRLLSEGGWL